MSGGPKAVPTRLRPPSPAPCNRPAVGCIREPKRIHSPDSTNTLEQALPPAPNPEKQSMAHVMGPRRIGEAWPCRADLRRRGEALALVFQPTQSELQRGKADSGIRGTWVRRRGGGRVPAGQKPVVQTQGGPLEESEGQSARRTRQRTRVSSLRRFTPPRGTACAGGSHPLSFGSGPAIGTRRAPAPPLPILPGQACGSAFSGQLRLVPGLRSLPELSGIRRALCGSRVESVISGRGAKGQYSHLGKRPRKA